MLSNSAPAQLGGPVVRGPAQVRALRAWASSFAPGENPGRIGLGLIAIALVVFFSLRHDTFFASGNAETIAINMSAIAIAVVGSSILLISGHIDLSIGSMYGLLGVIVARVGVETGGTLAPIIAGLLAGLTLGLVNGVLVRWLRISPLIVTVGMLAVYRGFAYVVSDKTVFGFSDALTNVGRGSIAGIQYPVVVAAAVFVLLGLWLTRTVGGLRVYALGGDALAASRAGVKVRRTVLAVYALNGLLIGLVAVLTTARLGSASPQLGIGFEFDVLTAAILGGVAFAGGAGRPVGIFVGVAVIGILNSGLVFEGLQDWWQQIAKGGILILALAADQLRHDRARRRIARAAKTTETQAPTASAVLGNGGTGAGVADPEPRQRGSGASTGQVFEIHDASKAYGAVRALESGSLRVRPGEIVCLLGDNGAGKSTLVKIMAGAIRPDTGEMRLDGRPVDFHNPGDARRAGFETVFQDLALCPNLSVAHNMVLGREPRRLWLHLIPIRDDRVARQETRRRLSSLGITLQDESVLVRALSGGQRQSVAICRALAPNVRVLCLDEPTAALGVTQTANVLRVVRSAAENGTGVIMVSHDVNAVREVADRIVSLRLGRVVYDGSATDLGELDLLRYMSGMDTAGGDRGGETNGVAAARRAELDPGAAD